MTDLRITEATVQLVVNEQEPVFLQVLRGPIVVSGGGGVTVHNDLTGRSDPDAHPISSITGLSAALAAAGNVDSVNGQTGTVVLDLDDLTDVDTTTDPPDADDVLAWDGVMWTPATLQALGAPDLSNATPADLGVAAPGVASEASRADHVHDMPTAADVGAAASLHVHSGADITSGTVSTARLGTGAADASTFLRGDGTWAGTAAPGWYTDLFYSGLMGPIGAVHGGGGTNMGTLATGFIYFWRVLPMCDVTIDGTSVVVGVGGGAGALVRVGIYAADTTGMPVGSPLCDSGSLGCSATGNLNATFSSAVLKGGRFYWAFIMSNSATMQTRFLGQNVQNTLRAALELVADSAGYNYTLRRATATFPTPPTNPTTAPLTVSQSVPSVIWRTRTT